MFKPNHRGKIMTNRNASGNRARVTTKPKRRSMTVDMEYQYDLLRRVMALENDLANLKYQVGKEQPKKTKVTHFVTVYAATDCDKPEIKFRLGDTFATREAADQAGMNHSKFMGVFPITMEI